jgi:hypothetical protein
VGGSVEITATPSRGVAGSRLTFDVQAIDGSGQLVAAGQIDRAIVDRQRLLASVSADAGHQWNGFDGVGRARRRHGRAVADLVATMDTSRRTDQRVSLSPAPITQPAWFLSAGTTAGATELRHDGTGAGSIAIKHGAWAGAAAAGRNRQGPDRWSWGRRSTNRLLSSVVAPGAFPSAWSRREGLSGAEHRLLGVGQAFEQIGGLCRGIVPGEVCLDYGGSGPKTWLTEDG